MSYLQSLLERDKDVLVNDLYNRKVAQYADYQAHETDSRGHGKRIPYVGWFWRNTDFVRKRIVIGDCGDFVGVMQSNKWGYPQRLMTAQEADTFIDYLERAFAALDDATTEHVCIEIWDWFQTLTVERGQS